MRAFLKELLKAAGTPVLQTFEGGDETILSAGNIWTSAHARRIELAERGLMSGAVLCSAAGGFQAVIEFVACAIGGFVYLPVSSTRWMALRQELATASVAQAPRIIFASEREDANCVSESLSAALAPIPFIQGAHLALYRDEGPTASVDTWTGDQLTELLSALSVRLGTPIEGTRMTCNPAHHEAGFVADLLLGLYNRQTIYIRRADRSTGVEVVREAIDLEVDDLVLAPPLLDYLAQTVDNLSVADRRKLQRIRLHTGGRLLSEQRAKFASSLFGHVFVEALQPSQAQIAA